MLSLSLIHFAFIEKVMIACVDFNPMLRICSSFKHSVCSLATRASSLLCEADYMLCSLLCLPAVALTACLVGSGRKRGLAARRR